MDFEKESFFFLFFCFFFDGKHTLFKYLVSIQAGKYIMSLNLLQD